MNNSKKSVFYALACSMCLISGNAAALGDQWYIGLGGGSTWLQPNPREVGLDIERRLGVGGNLFFGVDIDDRSSGQLTLYGLGDAELENTQLVAYQAFDGSVLYRFYDTKDGRLRRGGMHLALYGRFGLGFLYRDKNDSVQLENDSAVYFGAGAGAEWFINNTFSMRLEGMYHDKDAASGSLQLVGRFGGRSRPTSRPGPLPQPENASVQPEIPTESSSTQTPAVSEPAVPTAPAVPSVPSVPSSSAEPAAPSELTVPTPSAVVDADGDKIPDAQDECPDSRLGYPVRSTGCSLFSGVLSGVKFGEGSSELLPGASAQLDYLANVLAEYPRARVELHSHTNDTGATQIQADLTRARVRTIGRYLVRQGVDINRLVLRSFGGSKPLYASESEQGRDSNDRIEVIESGN